MHLFEFLGIIAAVFQVVGYYTYYRLSISGHIRPNAASWLIWFYGNAIVCISYLSIGEISLADLLPIVCAISNIVIVVALWNKKFFAPIEPYEKKVIASDIGITILWLFLEYSKFGNLFENATNIPVVLAVHLLLLLSACISFIPVIKDTLSDTCAEDKRPWIVWSFAYLIWFVAESLTGFSWNMVYPGLYLILHSTVFIILLIRKTKPVC
ncbi:MAG TPA: hypothetical protein PLQ20_00685 [Candidatus Paceibacterota bacterium]|nr:hypothetical protein [Candidatus Paceibacterota bacterium]